MDQLTPRPVLSVLHDDNEWRQSDNHRNRRFGDLLRRAGDFDRFCWLYPQHRNITLLRIEMLDPEQRRLLEIMVPVFERIRSSAICTQLAYTTQGLKRGRIVHLP